jgi:hypothetical protein
MPDANLADDGVLTSSFYNAYIREQVVVTCTSATRPTGVNGRFIFETDTGATLRHNGTSWVAISTPWAAYTPSLANVTLGNGTLTFRWRKESADTIHVRGKLVFGSTTSVSGLIGFGYPAGFTPVTSPRNLGSCWVSDATASPPYFGTVQAASSMFVYGNTTTPRVTGTSATSPFTWAVSDEIDIDIVVEVS